LRPKSGYSRKKILWLPRFKGRACQLDFPANFTAWQFLGPEKSVKLDFWDQKFDKRLVLDPKVNLKSKSHKSRFKVSFFLLKLTLFALIWWFSVCRTTGDKLFSINLFHFRKEAKRQFVIILILYCEPWKSHMVFLFLNSWETIW